MQNIFDGRELWVVGSGGSAKSLLKALRNLKLQWKESLIIKSIAAPKKVDGLLNQWGCQSEIEETWEKFKKKRLLLAIGGEKGQQLVDQFKSWGWKQPGDFVKLV